MAILLVEQNAAMALALSDRAILLETGSIVRIDDADVLATDQAVQHAYLGTS
jgi:branched-chain amino acid transport system ATP-binding protein